MPVTRYARSGDVHIAWQALGDGPVDLIFVPGWMSHVEANWRFPEVASFLRTLARSCRLLVFDKRGTGLSDPMPRASTMEERMDDVRAVLDAASVRRAVVFGASEGVSLSILFAATYPERTLGLLLCTVREFPQAERFLRAGKWMQGQYPLTKATLRDRTVGVIEIYGRSAAAWASCSGTRATTTPARRCGPRAGWPPDERRERGRLARRASDPRRRRCRRPPASRHSGRWRSWRRRR